MEERKRLFHLIHGATVEFVTTTQREYDMIVVKKEESKDYAVLLDLETWAFEIFDKRNLRTAKDILNFYRNIVTVEEFERMPKMVESLSGTYCTGKVQSGEDWYYTYKNFETGEKFDVWNRLDQPDYPSMPNVCLVDSATMRLREKRNDQIPYSCYDPYTKTLRVEKEISRWEYLRLEDERLEKMKKLREAQENQERKETSATKVPQISKIPKSSSNVDNTKTEEDEESFL